MLLILGYGIFVGIGVAATYGCTVNNLLRFFPDKRGLIGRIATASYGISSVIIPPLANMLIKNIGISNTMKYLGISFLVITCLSAMLIDRCPDSFVPRNYRGAQAMPGTVEHNKTWKEMLRSPVFYIMLLILICGAFSGIMVISQASPIAQNLLGVNASTAALTVSILSLCNAIGRIGCGRISDTFGWINTITTMLCVAIAGMAILFVSGTSSMFFYIGIGCVGLSFGALMGIYPGFTGDQFGIRYNNINFGFMFLGFAIAGIIGPATMTAIFNATGNYGYTFLIAMYIAFSGVLLTFLYRLVDKVKH